MSAALDAMFATDGALARLLEGYRRRQQQRAMADDVARVIAAGGVLACEAGTGTGKTLAYLLPAVAGGGRTIVSTGTRNLQEQLYFRDLPVALEAVGVRRDRALLKGRSNYLCLHRLHLHAQDGRFRDPRVPADLSAIRRWAGRTSSGDTAELASVSEDSPAWRHATSSRDNCLGAACAWYDDCHVFRARRRAAEADLVVVNHHLLLAQLALDGDGHGELLPCTDLLVVDEAHQLPDLATEFFSITLTSGQLSELARDVELARRIEAPDAPGLSQRADATAQAGREFRLALGEGSRRVAWSAVHGRAGVRQALTGLRGALGELCSELEQAAERGRSLAACMPRAADLAERLELLDGAGPEDHVSWLDASGRGFSWRLSPLDAAADLGPRLKARHASIVLTSATLALAGDLSHFTTRIGVADAEARVYDSPFDFGSQALLYLPPALSDPRGPDFAPSMYRSIEPVLEASRGRAFVLFTSHAALDRARRELAPRLPFTVLAQGDAPRGELLERFRAAGDGVLLGTYSFWEGVDVRGDALSCVIIDKLPFAPPDDPLLRARHDALRAQGRDPFIEQQLPQAAILLKQGVGRLIRDARDRGVVVICDGRLLTQGYGRRLLASLPPMPVTQDVAQVTDFFRRPSRAG